MKVSERLIRDVWGDTEIYLHVEDDQVAANYLYEKIGYVPLKYTPLGGISIPVDVCFLDFLRTLVWVASRLACHDLVVVNIRYDKECPYTKAGLRLGFLQGPTVNFQLSWDTWGIICNQVVGIDSKSWSRQLVSSITRWICLMSGRSQSSSHRSLKKQYGSRWFQGRFTSSKGCGVRQQSQQSSVYY